jgi:HlyD family secretion protein
MEFVNNSEPVHTEQMQDIIGKPPRWLYRWGITLVLGIGLICVFISSRINYPEVIQTRLKLLPLSSPYTVAVNDSARLVKILVQNDREVKKGDSLAIAQSSAGETFIKAPLSGKLTYASIIIENQQLKSNQEIYYISSGNNGFYGEMIIPPNDIDNVKAGQTVVVKLRNKNTGTLKGVIKYITDYQLKNEQYVAEVDFNDYKRNEKEGRPVSLRKGMVADAEIITANTTLLLRLLKSLTKGIK